MSAPQTKKFFPSAPSKDVSDPYTISVLGGGEDHQYFMPTICGKERFVTEEEEAKDLVQVQVQRRWMID